MYVLAPVFLFLQLRKIIDRAFPFHHQIRTPFWRSNEDSESNQKISDIAKTTTTLFTGL